MKELQFNIKVSHIVKFEEETGQSILTVFDQNSMRFGNFVKLAKCCSSLTDEDIDNFVAENGVEAFIEELLKGLVAGGFISDTQANQAVDEANEAEAPEKK